MGKQTLHLAQNQEANIFMKKVVFGCGENYCESPLSVYSAWHWSG